MEGSQLLFLLPVAALLLFFVVQGIRYGGPRAALIGARIKRPFANVAAVNSLGFPLKVSVSELESGDPNKAVAVELTFRLIGHFSWIPLTLSRTEALKLSEALAKASGSVT